MKTIVLDDDPTGTQSASGVTVLLQPSVDALYEVLSVADSVYVLTNSRAIPEAAAIALISSIRTMGQEVGLRLGEEMQYVLRGDSTLRGHVFAESETLLDEQAVLLFVPAFPDGGRTTVGGVHYVTVAGERVPASHTEFAKDPVFPFSTAVLVDYVYEKSGRSAKSVGLDDVRGVEGLVTALTTADPGSVILPDVVTNDDIRFIADAVRRARVAGATIVVRCASPLAASLAGVESKGLLPVPLLPEPQPTLVVCGSHTAGATAQLAGVSERHGPPLTIDTNAALADASATGAEVGRHAVAQLTSRSLAIIATERDRSDSHNTLAHGEQIMAALTRAVRVALAAAQVVVSKGGITSAEVATVGMGATRATVLGQVRPGVSVWSVPVYDGRTLLYVVVPGNVGGPETLLDVLAAVSVTPAIGNLSTRATQVHLIPPEPLGSTP